MKRPRIKLFGQKWNVLEIGFHEETGKLDRIIYQQFHGHSNLCTEAKMVNYGNGPVELKEPIVHPHENYVIAPNLNDLFVNDDK